jgi:hypothetical protein
VLGLKREDYIMMVNGTYVDKQYVLIKKMNVLQGKMLAAISDCSELWSQHNFSKHLQPPKGIHSVSSVPMDPFSLDIDFITLVHPF